MISAIERTRLSRRANAARSSLIAALFALAVAVVLILPTQARAVNPEATVGGAGSKWYSGSLMMQSGLNCSTAILGSAYSETMVSAIGGYGGAPGSGVVHVNDRYYASLLVSIPGNPCGSGSTFVTTDLILPRGTAYDSSASIRCFGTPRFSSDFVELTGGNWTLPPSLGGGSGPYCPATAGLPQTGYGDIGIGYRPLANGQMFKLFVPIKST